MLFSLFFSDFCMFVVAARTRVVADGITTITTVGPTALPDSVSLVTTVASVGLPRQAGHDETGVERFCVVCRKANLPCTGPALEALK